MLQRRLVFQALDASWTSLAVLVLVVAAAVLVALLSKYERKLVPPHVGYGLLVLRLAVIAVIWLALLQPVLTWNIDRERTGRIVVALDLSESMTTSDRIATKAEKLRTAIGLGMIGNEQNRDRWLRVLADFEAEREPKWVDDDEGANAEQRVTLAKTRKELVNETFQKLDKLPRAEIAQKLIGDKDKPDGWLAELQKSFNVELRVFGGKSVPREWETLAAAVQRPPDARQVDDQFGLGSGNLIGRTIADQSLRRSLGWPRDIGQRSSFGLAALAGFECRGVSGPDRL